MANKTPNKPKSNHPWRTPKANREVLEWAKDKSFQPIIKDYTKKKGQF